MHVVLPPWVFPYHFPTPVPDRGDHPALKSKTQYYIKYTKVVYLASTIVIEYSMLGMLLASTSCFADSFEVHSSVLSSNILCTVVN